MVVFNLLIFVFTIVCMEIFSWAIHKYVMHGFLWSLHKSHHLPHKGFFELNDVFPLFFGGSATLLMVLGFAEFDYRFWIGAGITTYGMLYFILHDFIIHRRLNGLKMFNTPYFQAVTRAHKMHHKHLTKEDGESFGLLFISKKYFKK